MKRRVALGIACSCLQTVPSPAATVDGLTLAEWYSTGSEAGVASIGGPITEQKPENVVLRPLDVPSGTAFIHRTGDIGSGISTLLQNRNSNIALIDDLAIRPAPGIEGGRITLLSRTVSLTGGTIVGRAILSPTAVVSGSSGTAFSAATAPVPLPAAQPLFATGLGLVALVQRRRWTV